MSIPSVLIALFISALGALAAWSVGGSYNVPANDIVKSIISMERGVALWAMSECDGSAISDVAELSSEGFIDATSIRTPGLFRFASRLNGGGIIVVEPIDQHTQALLARRINGAIIGQRFVFHTRKINIMDGSMYGRNIKSQTDSRCGA